jgi:hypothetical protein
MSSPGHHRIDVVEELAELDRAVPGEATADYGPRPDVERREQAGGAVASIVVGTPLRPPRPQRQQRLGAVQRLHLGLLVHGQHQRPIRWSEVEPDDIAYLLGKQGGRSKA